MPYHRFKVGQTVVAPSGVRDALIPRGPYVIVRLLPPIDDKPHYRVKSAADGHERALLEPQIRPVAPEPAPAASGGEGVGGPAVTAKGGGIGKRAPAAKRTAAKPAPKKGGRRRP